MAEQHVDAADGIYTRRRADFESLSDTTGERETDTVNQFAPLTAIRQRQRGDSSTGSTSSIHAYDPYSPKTAPSLPIHKQYIATENSLFDDSSVDVLPVSSETVPGVAGYLEMEEEPPRDRIPPIAGGAEEPIQTSSGLLLTHRRTPTAVRKPRPQPASDDDDKKQSNVHFFRVPNAFRPATAATASQQRDYFEVENGWVSRGHSHSPNGTHSMAMLQARRLMSFVRLWMIVIFILLFAATGVLVHSFQHDENEIVQQNESVQQNSA
jgi:hypothetical protein